MLLNCEHAFLDVVPRARSPRQKPRRRIRDAHAIWAVDLKAIALREAYGASRAVELDQRFREWLGRKLEA